MLWGIIGALGVVLTFLAALLWLYLRRRKRKVAPSTAHSGAGFIGKHIGSTPLIAPSSLLRITPQEVEDPPPPFSPGLYIRTDERFEKIPELDIDYRS